MAQECWAAPAEPGHTPRHAARQSNKGTCKPQLVLPLTIWTATVWFESKASFVLPKKPMSNCEEEEGVYRQILSNTVPIWCQHHPQEGQPLQSCPSAARVSLGLHMPWLWGQFSGGGQSQPGLPKPTAGGCSLGCSSGWPELHQSVKSCCWDKTRFTIAPEEKLQSLVSWSYKHLGH